MTLDTQQIKAIVIGGSAGAFAALKILLPVLPETLAVPVIIVLHLPPDRPSALADLFGQNGLPAKEAEDKEPLEPGTVYFAPPDYHLLVESERSLALAADEPVHFSRPSIDVLFESAAEVFSSHLLAVILSGASEDGAAGLEAVRAHGGITVVQQPETSEHALMPSAAIRLSTPTAILPLEEIAGLFASLPGQCLPHRTNPTGGGSV